MHFGKIEVLVMAVAATLSPYDQVSTSTGTNRVRPLLAQPASPTRLPSVHYSPHLSSYLIRGGLALKC